MEFTCTEFVVTISNLNVMITKISKQMLLKKKLSGCQIDWRRFMVLITRVYKNLGLLNYILSEYISQRVFV